MFFQIFHGNRDMDMEINLQKLWIYEFVKWLVRPFILSKIIYSIKKMREKTLKISLNA